MNYTPFSGHFATQVPAGTVQHYTTAKFAQNVAAPAGQVLGVISSMSEDGVTYVRPVDSNGLTVNLAQSQAVTTQQNQVQPTFISIPVQVPGNKPGDPPQQQMLQIQVVAPSSQSITGLTCDSNQPKYHMAPLIAAGPGNATVVQFAYNNQQGDTVEVPIPPLMQAIQQQTQQPQSTSTENGECNSNNNNNNQQHATIQIQTQTDDGDSDKASHLNAGKVTVVKVEKDKRFGEQTIQQYVEMPSNWQSLVQPGSTVADCLAKLPATIPHGLTSFLKFAPATIKREAEIESSPLSTHSPEGMSNDLVVSSEDPLAQDHSSDMTIATEAVGQAITDGVKKPPKVKKKYKKKNPKPKKTRPGQVTIATALDGTTLFCCPECNMAYSEKELLEQHLAVHKTERRFICDTCGAALKRKEHLERHKLGHNPERPYTCTTCFKGFKRKEHLNLHVVIHSGEKTQVCNECGKGFYRKDHLRKHARSHLTKKIKEELGLVPSGQVQNVQRQDQQSSQTQTMEDGSPVLSILPNQDDVNDDGSIDEHQHHMETTVVLPTQAETSTIMLQHHHH